VADPLNRDPASLESCFAGQFGALVPHAGIRFIAHAALTLIDLRGDPQDAAFLASARRALGIALPLKPNTAVSGQGCEVLWLGPDEWLLAGRDPTQINDRLPIEHGFLTDVSHGRAGWRIGGPHALDLLAKGCSLDLHPRAFRAGDCAQTAFAHVGILLHRRATESFDLYCARSYAQHLWHSLTGAAAEFGYEVHTPASE